MKNVIFTLAFSAILSFGIAQRATVTSVANGNFLMPTTWDCGCIPQTTDNIVIKHHVILNTNWGITSVSLTINSGGSLVKDATVRSFAMNGGTFTNNGYCNIDRFAVYTGTLINNDSLHINQVLYNTGTITTTGKVYGLDSLYTAGTFSITNTGSVTATNFMNALNAQNSGHVNLTYFLNTGTYTSAGITTVQQYLNTGTSTINDTVNVTVDFENMGNMNVSTNIPFLVAHDFLNKDSINHDAVFNNNGIVIIGNDFTNTDTLKGNGGSFCVAAYSTNTGYFKGTIDFCDQTPLITVPINIDINTGVIGPNVTSCTHSCGTVGLYENKQEISDVHVFPNPFTDAVKFELSGMSNSKTSLSIFDILGNKVFSGVYDKNEIIINRKELKDGLYFYHIENGSTIITGKLIAE
jgi:hypothetical protein